MTEKYYRVRDISFNPCFRDANCTRARYRILCGGAGSGKSFNTAQDLILKLSDEKYRGANLMVVRKTEAANRNSAFAELCGAVRRIFGDESEKYWRIRQEPMMLESLVTGNAVIFRGMKDAAQRERVKSVSFESGKLTWIWCEEATELEAEDLDILDDRLRGELASVNPELYFQITLTFNPTSATHWIKRRFFDAPLSEDVFIHRSVFGDNRFIDGEYAVRMERRRLYDPEGYRVYALGEWGGSGEGLILPHFEVDRVRDVHVDRSCLAQDFGYNHANCILQVGECDGDILVMRELYCRGLDTGEIIHLSEEQKFPKSAVMYCDSAEPDRIKMWRDAGYRAVPVKKGAGSVASQIDFLKGRRIVVDESCVNLIRELGEWRWMKDSVSGEFIDVPAPSSDDAIAALRYSVSHFRRRYRTVDKGALGL